MAFSIHLKQFDGPLDLLLTLIGNAKIEPKDIFVSEVTAQYIEIVRSAPDFDMEETSDFIRMAALLVEIKSRRILPRPPKEEPPEEDPEQQLIARLEEYSRFKQCAEKMSLMEDAAAKTYGKLPEEVGPMEPRVEWGGLTLQGLWNALLAAMGREPPQKEEKILKIRKIQRDMFSIEECMERIRSRLRLDGVSFEELFSEDPCREEAVTLFLALLEVIKLGEAHVEQKGPLAPIQLWPGPAPLEAFQEEELRRGRKKREAPRDE